MEEIDIPPFYLCPISLEIMKDPVTLSTGITYDRENIEKWLYSDKNQTCPVSKQPLSDSNLTPNQTLRRLIRSWCTLNASHGIQAIPSPKPPITKTQISKLLNEYGKSSPLSQLTCLQTLRSVASESETNKRTLEALGTGEFLTSIIITGSSSGHSFELTKACHEEALSILYNLKISQEGLKSLILMKNNDGGRHEFIDSLTKVMQNGTYESRAYAIMFLNSVFEISDQFVRFSSFGVEFFIEIVRVLKDEISKEASRAALLMLIRLGPYGRTMAVEAGAVTVLIEILLGCSEKRVNEMVLMALELLSGCAEGRAEILRHGAGIAVVAKKILRVSQAGNESAVRILCSVVKCSAGKSGRILEEMVELEVVKKLCLLLQVNCESKTREKVVDVLKLYSGVWRKSSCLPFHLLSSYPS